jgi:hypothetical protein
MTPDENVVAVIDILGYTRLLEEMTLDDLQSLIQHGILGALHTAKLLSGEVVVLDEVGALREYEKVVRVEYVVISDTIILYPKRGTDRPLVTLCTTISLVMSELLAHGVLLRGAVDVDTFRKIDGESIFIGRALVGAHELELAQDWSGCSLTGRVARRFSKQIKQMRTDGLVVEYEVPMKPGVYRRGRPRWALNWLYHNLNDPEAKRARLQDAHENAPELAKGKVMAAIEFERFLRATGNSFAAPVSKQLFDRSQIRGGYRFVPRECR